MGHRRLKGSFWPSRHQQLLLEAALGDPAEAPAAWQKLRPQLDLQTIDSASFVTLPLVYHSLEAAEVDDPLLPRLKGIYRNVWAKNNLLVERLKATAKAFDAGVPMLLVGSIGAALRYYPAPGFRPTPYVEFIVQEDAFVSAVRALGRSGWIARDAERRGKYEPLVLADREGGLCLLRTALAPDFTLHAALWSAAMPIDVRGAPVPALSPTDDLLAAIVTGARVGSEGSIQWIVDAAMILRSVPEQIDWERLAHIGIECGQGLRLRDALEYLRRSFGLVPPALIGRRLDEWHPSPRERLIHACTVRAVRGSGSLPQAIGEHLAATAGRSVPATIAALPAFLRERWQLERNWRLPLAGGQRAYRILVRGGPHGHG
jgi:hypothetical protein